MWQQIQVEFHARRERRVSEKEVRWTDGQILCEIHAQSLFSFNQTLPFSPPPSVSVAPLDTFASRVLKAKNPAMQGDRWWINQGGRSEGGVRNSEVCGRKRGLAVSALTLNALPCWGQEVGVVKRGEAAERSQPGQGGGQGARLASLSLECLSACSPLGPSLRSSPLSWGWHLHLPPQTGRAVLQGSLALEEEGKWDLKQGVLHPCWLNTALHC